MSHMIWYAFITTFAPKKANAWNVSYKNSLLLPIDIINSVSKTK